MKSVIHGVVLFALATSGVIVFACGGASTSAANTAPPPESATASASATPELSAASTSVSPSASVATSAAPFVVVPMKLDLGAQSMDVQADGTVMAGGLKILRFVGADLLDATHAIAASVAANGTVTFEGAQKTSRFDDHDALEFDGSKIVIADDGTVNVFDAKGRPDSDNGKLKFAGFQPSARRAAAVLVAWSQVAAERMMKNMPKLMASVNRAVQQLTSAVASASSSAKPLKH